MGIAVLGCFAGVSFAQAAKKPAGSAAGTARAQGTTARQPARTKKAAPAPTVDWGTVSATAAPPQLEKAALGRDQVAIIELMLMGRAENDGWGCEDDVPPEDWLKDLTYWRLPLLPSVPAVLVQAGNACGRSSQDSPNGAMWIVVFHGRDPVLLATPQESFNGALYSVQATRTRGMPDVVVTWRVSATESDLTYLQFDGGMYVAVHGAKLIEGSGAPRIEPMKIPAE